MDDRKVEPQIVERVIGDGSLAGKARLASELIGGQAFQRDAIDIQRPFDAELADIGASDSENAAHRIVRREGRRRIPGYVARIDTEQRASRIAPEKMRADAVKAFVIGRAEHAVELHPEPVSQRQRQCAAHPDLVSVAQVAAEYGQLAVDCRDRRFRGGVIRHLQIVGPAWGCQRQHQGCRRQQPPAKTPEHRVLEQAFAVVFHVLQSPRESNGNYSFPTPFESCRRCLDARSPGHAARA